MMMRNLEISVGEHYHLYSSGVRHENIFVDDDDRIRFIFLILHMQSDTTLFHVRKNVLSFKKYKSFIPHHSTVASITSARTVELVNFALMSNHFHLTVKETREGGISKYLQRVLTAYSMYFNLKHKRTGHLFESAFKAVHVKSNEQLLHLSAYIHKNPTEIREWRGRESEYPWSSFPDYAGESRWGELLQADVVLGQFPTKDDYKKFVETSRAKEVRKNLGDSHIFDDL